MGFIMDGLDAESYDRQYSDRYLVNRIVSYFRPHLRKMGVVAVVIMLTSLVDTSVPIVISRAIDQLQRQGEAANLLPLAIAVTLLASSSWVFNFVRRWLSSRVIGDVV